MRVKRGVSSLSDRKHRIINCRKSRGNNDAPLVTKPATTSLSDRTFASTVAPISLVQASESVLAETLQTFAQTLMEALGEGQEVFAKSPLFLLTLFLVSILLFVLLLSVGSAKIKCNEHVNFTIPSQ